jgi:hypothetical protein
MLTNHLTTAALLLAAMAVSTSAFIISPFATVERSRGSHHAAIQRSGDETSLDQTEYTTQRRFFLQNLSTTAASAAAISLSFPNVVNAEAESMERGGVPLTPFNSLAFNYRGKSDPQICCRSFITIILSISQLKLL